MGNCVKRGFLGKTDQGYICQSITSHYAKMFQKTATLWEIMRYKVENIWAKLDTNCLFAWKGDVLGKLTNTTIVYLLCPFMPQCLKNILILRQIIRYEMLQFWAKLDINHPFSLKGNFFKKLTDVNFVYFKCPITILQCLKKSLKWITKYNAA